MKKFNTILVMKMLFSLLIGFTLVITTVPSTIVLNVILTTSIQENHLVQ